MNATQISPDNFLGEVYEQLRFNVSPHFYHITNPLSSPDLAQASWFEQARKLGAETIFFVDDYPTILFFKLDSNLDIDAETVEDQIRQLHLQVWNTSRVPLFFVALPGELRIYSAYQKPARNVEEWRSENRWLEQVKAVSQVVELQEFSRPQVESGHLFQLRSKDFSRENRVDQWLLKNLRLLRQKLGGANPQKREYVHALIGRSIFIRYLEHRKVLVEDYFADISPSGGYQSYTDVLGNHKDTYNNLFPKLRNDFNGDLFPLSPEEEKIIQETDLHLLRDFLLGRSMADQPDLLFWAYQFDIIPIELISNIYEEFYHEHGDDDDQGTHYTPTPLVDFILSQCLTTERLNAGARVLDPACGSGIFLVEAFKRMVHHERRQQGKDQLSRAELITLLTERIVGIDVNASAVQIAAFSLYLALLDFLTPPDIRQQKQLPKLVYNKNSPDSGKNLFHANAFYLTVAEQAQLDEYLNKNKRYQGRVDDVKMNSQPTLPLDDFQFDVIIGNPPWGSGSSSEHQLAAQWCKAFRYPVGDQELSQCFMWRAKKLLKPGGEIGLLVSTGVFFKHQDNSRDFRQQWLQQNRVRAVYNFAHVRQVFFRKQKKDAIAPFAAVFFTPTPGEEILNNRISYISIKQNALIEQLQAIIIDKADLRKARQSEFLTNDWLWKAYMWGSLNDVELIEELKSCYQKLSDIVSVSGRGYQGGGDPKSKSTHELGVNFELNTASFYKNAEFSALLNPIEHRMIHRLGEIEIYKGSRLLIKRGISRGGRKFGEIQARLADEPFAVTDDFIGFRIDRLPDAQKKVVLGIMLSSLAKYYYFLTCSMWGFWHFKIHTIEHLSLPISFPENPVLEKQISDIVTAITPSSKVSSWFASDTPKWRAMQDELDNAIFDLYELSKSQRDLVRDLCQVTLEFFYDGVDSQAAKPPTVTALEDYRDAFLEVWEERLARRGKELETRIYIPHHGLLCGVSFELKDLGTAVSVDPITDNSEWQRWFRRLSKSLRKEYSDRIYIDRVLKELSDSSMFIVKRAEYRFWTKSQARQDAQELLTEVFKLEWPHTGSLA